MFFALIKPSLRLSGGGRFVELNNKIDNTISSLTTNINAVQTTANNALPKSMVSNATNVTAAGYALDARQGNANVSGSLRNSINELTTVKYHNIDIKVALENSHGIYLMTCGKIASLRFHFIPTSSIANNSVVAIMPVGARPKEECKFLCYMYEYTTGNIVLNNAVIYGNGELRFDRVVDKTKNDWVWITHTYIIA